MFLRCKQLSSALDKHSCGRRVSIVLRQNLLDKTSTFRPLKSTSQTSA